MADESTSSLLGTRAADASVVIVNHDSILTAAGSLECRICGGSSELAKPLISPCACSGSVALVHPACLQQWIETRPHSNALECELCHEQYAVTFLRRLKCDTDHLCTFASLSHLAEGGLLVFTLVCIILLAVFLRPYIGEESPKEVAIVVALALVASIATFFALAKVYIRWRHAASESELVMRGAH